MQRAKARPIRFFKRTERAIDGSLLAILKRKRTERNRTDERSHFANNIEAKYERKYEWNERIERNGTE